MRPQAADVQVDQVGLDNNILKNENKRMPPVTGISKDVDSAVMFAGSL